MGWKCHWVRCGGYIWIRDGLRGALVKQNNEKLGHAAQRWIRAEGHAQVACAWLAPPWVCRYAPAAERVMV